MLLSHNNPKICGLQLFPYNAIICGLQSSHYNPLLYGCDRGSVHKANISSLSLEFYSKAIAHGAHGYYVNNFWITIISLQFNNLWITIILLQSNNLWIISVQFNGLWVTVISLQSNPLYMLPSIPYVF